MERHLRVFRRCDVAGCFWHTALAIFHHWTACQSNGCTSIMPFRSSRVFGMLARYCCRWFRSVFDEAGVDKQFRYHEKRVHDVPVGNLIVRVWSADGAIDGAMIRAAFRPLAAIGFVWPYAALMPDYHPGEGSMIGSVIPTCDILLPTVIGGDLGCGVAAVRLPVNFAQAWANCRASSNACETRFPSERPITPSFPTGFRCIRSGGATCVRRC